jgi:hypothetical protein
MDGWGGRDGIEFDGQHYLPDFRTNSQLFTTGQERYMSGASQAQVPINLVHLWPLRAVGLTDGVTIKIEGLFPASVVRRYGELMRLAVNMMYANAMGNIDLTVKVAA